MVHRTPRASGPAVRGDGKGRCSSSPPPQVPPRRREVERGRGADGIVADDEYPRLRRGVEEVRGPAAVTRPGPLGSSYGQDETLNVHVASELSPPAEVVTAAVTEQLATKPPGSVTPQSTVPARTL